MSIDPFTLLSVMTALALGNLWRQRREARVRLLLLTVPFVLLMVISTPAMAYLATGSLEWSRPPAPLRADASRAIVVLGGGLYPPSERFPRTELSASTINRCLLAARLYKLGEPRPVVVSGGKKNPRIPGTTLAEAMRDFLLEQGVAATDIVLEKRSRNTYENALRTAELLKARGMRQVDLVTDGTHLLRSELCFRAQGLEPVLWGSDYRAREFRWNLFTFLPSSTGARDFYRALHEWLGMLWYKVAGRI